MNVKNFNDKKKKKKTFDFKNRTFDHFRNDTDQ